MQKLKMQSADLVSVNIEKIAALFPNVITESRDEIGTIKKAINFDKLKQELQSDILDGEESYDFTWVGKKASIVEASTPIRKTLRPCKDESKGWEKTGNLYIEGDNLEVLKLLQESYLGKIKMIYIDPPYNTGKDFIYRDNFTQSKDEYEEDAGMFDKEGNRLFQNTESNGRFHSDWCSMIYARLKLSRNLLSEDGLIVINMDENEIINLQKICNEVFGEENDLGTIIWDKRNPKGDARGISYQHEYIIMYARDKEFFLKRNSVMRPKKNAKFILKKANQLFSKINRNYTLEQVNKEFSSWVKDQVDYSGGEKAYCNIDENGEVYRPVSMAWPNKKKAPADYFIALVHPVTKKPCSLPERGWRNPSSTMQELQKKGLILYGKDETIQPTRKYFLKENIYENIPSLLYYGGSDTDLLDDLGVPFETPKVINICVEHIQSFTKDGDIILDYFSGSSTIAHAVMQANACDTSNRKFIMVQLDEPCDEKSEAYKAGYKNICEIGKERIRRAGEKIKSELAKKSEGTLDFNDGASMKPEDLDIGFRVFKIDSSNMKDIYYSAHEIDQGKLDDYASNIEEDRTPLDLLYQCMLDWALPLSLPHSIEKIENAEVHTVDNGALIACFDKKIPESVVREIAKRKPLRAVFRDAGFASSQEKINVTEIFKTLAPDTEVKVI
jgi:adenine-specific DNA-methyltransferase